ncbi:dynein axonemal assembly factor 8 isoform X2 [Tamandua tetradactyla]|uniref:dynein axonemal assembly factor 8 isoform X2 n=1 Tax=Tamandua tetradactyla TaxID=48850 RepID=UPI00405434CF
MASKDKDEVAGQSSLWISPQGPWDAIFEAVRGQLPSLDSDSSSSDSEDEESDSEDGELFIFQREESALVPDLSELLGEEPAQDPAAPESWSGAYGGPPREPVLVPVEFTAELGSKWKARAEDSAFLEGGDSPGPLQSCAETSSLRLLEETPRGQEGNLESVPCNTKEPQSAPWGLQGGAAVPAWEAHLKMEAAGTTLAPQQGWDSANLSALRRERRKMIEKDILRKVTRDAPDAASGGCFQVQEPAGPSPDVPLEHPREGPPVLSLQQLEEWDLDYILQGLTAPGEEQGDGAPAAPWWTAHRPQGPGLTAPGAQDRLMEQLSLLSAAQARVPSSARKVPADGPQDAKDPEAGSRCTSAKPGWGLAGALRLQGPAEPPTVFIDLRQTEPPAQWSSESSTCSSSDSKEEEEEEEEEEEKGKEMLVVSGSQQGPVERACPSSQHRRDRTGKSQLLQQLRAFRKASAQPQLSVGLGPGCPKREDLATSGPGKEPHVKLWAAGQSIQARPPGGSTRAGVPGTSGEALVPPLGQP